MRYTVVICSLLKLISIYILTGCVNKVNDEKTPQVPMDTFAKGADVSWLPQMEKSGFKFYDDLGNQKDCLDILKEHGMNTIRLRTWVNPSNDPYNGHCSTAETVEMAVRAKNKGFRLMIDFHYSDTWSDPANQKKPAAWQKHSFEELKEDIYNYTYEVMVELKNAGITPEWVQIGNEINPGMLLPDGSSENMGKLTQFINKGYEAVKKVSPETLAIIHIASGADTDVCRWFFDGLKENKAEYDVIGLSYYPYWDKKSYKETIDTLIFNMNDMVKRYDKKVMIVETGGQDSEEEDTYNMLSEEIKKVREINEGKGLGVLYWEPEGAYKWSRYGLSCWREDGKPTKALDAFLE